MLRAGGTKRHKELLAPFGLDASDPGFWNKGLDVIVRLHRPSSKRMTGGGPWRGSRSAAIPSSAARVQRYARVSTAVGGLAARLAGERYLGHAARSAAATPPI